MAKATSSSPPLGGEAAIAMGLGMVAKGIKGRANPPGCLVGLRYAWGGGGGGCPLIFFVRYYW